MFLEHFGVREDPFGVTPDPRFLYLSVKHHEALSKLQSGIENNRGFLALIAPPGLGKTTLLYHMLEQLRRTQSAATAFVFQTQCDSRELLRQIVTDFGIETDDWDTVRTQRRLHEFLAQEAKAGRFVIVFIDEAQNLSAEALETLRLLSNFETAKSKLLQIVLAGQPALASRLCEPTLVQLKQRLFAMIKLGPLSAAETRAYIAHRLTVAGYKGSPLFSPEAQALIVRRSEGIPRMINAICYASLDIAYRRRERSIKESIVQDVLDVIAPRNVQEPKDDENEVAQMRPSVGVSFLSSTLEIPRLPTRADPSSKLSILEPSHPNSTLIKADANSKVTKAASRSAAALPAPITATSPEPRNLKLNGNKLLLGLLAIGAGVIGALFITTGLERLDDSLAAVHEEEIPYVHAAVMPAPVKDAATPSHQRENAKVVSDAKPTGAPSNRMRRSDPAQRRRADIPELEPTYRNLATPANSPTRLVAQNSTLASLPASDADSAIVSAYSMVSPVVASLPADSSSELMYSANPEYPDAAVRAGLQGTVMLKAVISSDGTVRNPRLITGDPVLAKAAIQTVLTWRYRPASVNGHPVESQAQIVFRFSLPRPAK